MRQSETKAEPVDIGLRQTAPTVVVTPTYKDAQTGALYVHQDLLQVQAPWIEEDHIGPMEVTERFGDVESFVSYIKRYGGVDTFLTWNQQGLQATIDYARDTNTHGRRRWLARLPFQTSLQWRKWSELANGQAINQRTAVERLEDLAADIREPASADLMNLLRSLRASVNAKADAELRPDGTTSVAFQRDTAVKAGASSIDLPAFITIAIPILKGHVDDESRPVVYKLQVRLRVSVDDQAHLTLRFSLPNAERTLEDVYADRVHLATKLLGESFQLLRAAD